MNAGSNMDRVEATGTRSTPSGSRVWVDMGLLALGGGVLGSNQRAPQHTRINAGAAVAAGRVSQSVRGSEQIRHVLAVGSADHRCRRVDRVVVGARRCGLARRARLM